jgi:dCMP deaminase
VRDKHVLSTGYDGAPSGMPHCLEVDNYCNYCLHAEQNAIIQAALFGVSTKGSTLYCTHQPCNICAKIIVHAGVERIVIGGEYPDEFAVEVLTTAGVVLEPNSNKGLYL